MPIFKDFECSVCNKIFKVSEDALAKYPGWEPRYCREHSPRKKENEKGAAKKTMPKASAGELDLPLAEVLKRFSAGPQTGIFTDGSARPNPGPGGWGLVYVKEGRVVSQKFGQETHTTNNRMELTALIEAFKLIHPADQVEVFTDSELCVNTVNVWAAGWEKKGWKRKTGPIKNLELIKELYALKQKRPLATLKWIEAHNGWLWNEYADSLATAWARPEL